jgi:preprotein translocase subunit SecE
MAVLANPAEQTPSVVTRAVGFYHGVVAELRKVTWPDVPQVADATRRIIIFVLAMALLIFLLDQLLSAILVGLIPSLFRSSGA